MDVKKVAVIGGGTMGNGIAHVFAMNDISVNLIETKQEFADKAVATIEKNLDRMVKKEKIDEAKKSATMDGISIFLDVEEGVKDVDLVVEAVPENFEIKKTVWEKVDKAAPDHAILGSNTSSISITKLAALTSRPEKFIGMHFFNPVPVMKLVEIVRGLQTDDETYEIVKETSEKLNKVPVPVNDAPGFVSNRVLMPMINEAIFCVGEGVATAEHVDEVMKLGMAHPMGPLRLADFIGLDVCLDILNVLYEGFKDPKYRPAPLLVKMVDAGKLGNKTGEGFYTYD
ncbi:MAG: 3-hydroxybutyryl-CoA dehydrogenase [Gracilimonas sp.]|uniref:3-hydroxyacyl-CoA dehydrogenase family protein n=1 Tax=Gracilimonas TaxID=649462 RepID=UPI001AFDA6E2|nr:3-hydroxybutyryl-CoA dehydrogenase [Gracilimonas sp.]MBO6586716.1 3-hydroxybutyryl-CoA dehydrogenase [Gracilimonas sp.]MBO6615373.1 3-hydroxybutyryl-CoA dehydrogenase [Gracilimonas sp.]